MSIRDIFHPDFLKVIGEKKIYMNFQNLSQNPNDSALYYLEQNPNYIVWVDLCKNTNPYAMDIIKQNIDNHKLNNKFWLLRSFWATICQNNSDTALDIIETNLKMINWISLSSNSNDRAIDLLKQNINKIDASELCSNTNPRIFEILVDRPDMINWTILSKNSCIFQDKHEILLK
jgi:hypothetical protein